MMKKEDIQQAYKELEFSENLQGRYFKNITSREAEKRKLRKVRLAPALLVFLLIGTTVYAAERLDFLEWYYGEDISLIRGRTDRREYSAENGHLKMSVESTVLARQYAAVFIHVQALDEEGRGFMQVNSGKIRMRLELEADGEECETSGWTEICDFQEDISDEENWYYVLKQVYHDSTKSEDCDGAAIYFPAEEQKMEAWMPGAAWRMELHLPFEERIGNERVYTECGEMKKVSVSPLSVNIEWEAVPEAYPGGYTWLKTLEIVMKDGKTLEYAEQISGKKICDKNIWEFAYTSGNYGEKGRKMMSLVLAKPLDMEQIEVIRVNGAVCEP